MEKIVLYKFQLKTIENTLRLIGNIFKLRTGESCLSRDFIQSERYIQNALIGDYTKHVSRFYLTAMEDMPIKHIEQYLEEKGYSVIRTTELEQLEERNSNHPG